MKKLIPTLKPSRVLLFGAMALITACESGNSDSDLSSLSEYPASAQSSPSSDPSPQAPSNTEQNAEQGPPQAAPTPVSDLKLSELVRGVYFYYPRNSTSPSPSYTNIAYANESGRITTLHSSGSGYESDGKSLGASLAGVKVTHDRVEEGVSYFTVTRGSERLQGRSWNNENEITELSYSGLGVIQGLAIGKSLSEGFPQGPYTMWVTLSVYEDNTGYYNVQVYKNPKDREAERVAIVGTLSPSAPSYQLIGINPARSRGPFVEVQGRARYGEDRLEIGHLSKDQRSEIFKIDLRFSRKR